LLFTDITTHIYIYYTVAAHLTFYAVITIFTNMNT